MTENTSATVRGSVQEKTMRAMVQEKYGPASQVLQLREVETPEVGDDEVLVKVHYSSVNALEWHLMNGKPYIFRATFGLRPKNPTLGADVSGVVEGVGSNVTGFKPGDEVFGEIGVGAYAEYATAKEHHLAVKPAGITHEEASAVGVAGLTALQGLRDIAGVKAGQKVLINGASGGVGTFAVQVAKVLGAEVTAVCSTRNVEMARQLGADRVVDYTKEDFTETDERFDVMFDIPGNRPLRDCKRLLAPGGTYVMVGGPKGNWTGPLFRLLRGKFLFMIGDKTDTSFTAESRADDLAFLGELLESGQIRSVIETELPLAEIAISLDRQGEFHAKGKTVIAVEGSL